MYHLSTLVNPSLSILNSLPANFTTHKHIHVHMMSNSSQKHAASKNGCFSSLLHRFLCSGGGLPTHPSSDIDSPKKLPASPTPNTNTKTTHPVGIVARLMGLDSIPNSPIMQKSRSVGSLDLLPNFQITKYHIHRRAISFREVPLHDLGKSDMGLTPIQEKSSSNNLRVDTNMKIIKKRRHSVKVKKEVPLKIRRKRYVVVDDGFPDGKNKYKSSRRVKRCNHSLPKMDDDIIKEKKKSMIMLKRRETHQDYCIKVVLNDVCRLTMVELQGDSVWVNNSNTIQQAEVSYEIGRQILQLLVGEIVDELCTGSSI